MSLLDPARLALAFAVLPWLERDKARLWGTLQNGGTAELGPEAVSQLEALDLPRFRSEAAERKGRLVLPGDEGSDAFFEPLPYPVALWVRGTLPPPGLRIAVVGTRTPSLLGRERARNWSRQLTEQGVGVISGLARGIDGAAHAGALEAGPTWGIMGSGLDHPYPKEHTGLMERIVDSGGGLITPFPPDALPLKWHFPRRNLLLAAWSRGVLVVEAKLKSGSLVTAKLALDLGKELWVVPGSPEDPLSEGPNSLLREGAARLCRSPADLLEDLAELG
ncbi:MAG: DNA-protecting protein DprA [Holophagaceae bacterium]|nr:DNA-protecting protein DprA [Holophagaceae bacterium]